MTKGKALRRQLAAAVLGVTLLTSLSGCIEMVVGTAMVTTALAASDRRTVGAQTEDRGIVIKGESRVSKVVGDSGHVNVNSFNRKVLLTGEVRTEELRVAVEREVGAVEGVQSVVNELVVAGNASLPSRSSDALITSKVKASFVDAKDIFANSIKVVTERGNVYLMGRVTEREGKRAGEITSGVSGVQKVIKAFDYISEEDLKKMASSS